MKCYVVGCFAGFVALDEDFNLMDYELFPHSELGEKWFKQEEGEETPEEKRLLEKVGKVCQEIIIETTRRSSHYQDLEYHAKITCQLPSKGGDYFRSNLGQFLHETGFLKSSDELWDVTRDLALEITEKRLKDNSYSQDLLLIQAIHTIEELEESEVKLVERLREWYPVHFPEMDNVRDHGHYVELVAQYGDRESVINSGALAEMVDEGVVSLGAELSAPDLEVIQGFAQTIRSIQESKKSTIDYVDQKMEEMAPNLRDLVGASLGAKIIAHAGGLKRLALLPSSTVQILGAEKALFRHLKTGERPPKHGLIYQHPAVRGSRWWVRGKIARALASKISLAVRKDYFSGEYDATIKEGFEKRVEEITKEYPFPKRSEKSKKKKKIKKRKKKKDKFRFKKGDFQY
ncbi:MAG: nucleolar protein 56 [Methanobacterium sp.]|jgi:nucleolar protein 56|uniref:NOP5/NOP56 family protein n=1 Tax=Methanobacterium sp. TaxID=2164 RepID=UPI0003C98B20|nr:Pre-mRNA processing ribonucleoprotein,-binding domain-containing protein [Methanobacterium sp.]MDI3549764.1 nucleolar protein 56 [Methanobacterium sp.]CDG65835.1 Pre-mRNA processing ribonucleoprotein, binding domain-containing protein [Methanobacterium sp. MB1]